MQTPATTCLRDGSLTRRGFLTLGAGLTLACCTKAAAAPRLSFWAMAQEGENAPVLLDPFERATGVGVDVQILPWTAAHQKILTAQAGRSLPDLLMVKNSWLPELATIGALQQAPAAAAAADSFPAAAASVHWNGRVMALPWVVDGWAQFYRPDLLGMVGYPAPPDHWAEWLRMAAAVKRRWPDRYATLHLLDWPEPLFAFAAQSDAPMLRDHSSRGNFSSAGFRAMLARYKLVFDAGFSPRLTGAEAGDTLIALRRGAFTILPSNAETIGDLRRRAAWFPESLWHVAPTPGDSGPARGLANGYSLAVASTSAAHSDAWRLARHLTAPEQQVRLYHTSGDLPARRGAWSTLGGDAAAAGFSEAVANSMPPPSVPEWEQVVTAVQTVAERMIRGEFGVDQATRVMDQQVDMILVKRRWLLDRGLVA